MIFKTRPIVGELYTAMLDVAQGRPATLYRDDPKLYKLVFRVASEPRLDIYSGQGSHYLECDVPTDDDLVVGSRQGSSINLVICCSGSPRSTRSYIYAKKVLRMTHGVRLFHLDYGQVMLNREKALVAKTAQVHEGRALYASIHPSTCDRLVEEAGPNAWHTVGNSLISLLSVAAAADLVYSSDPLMIWTTGMDPEATAILSEILSTEYGRPILVSCPYYAREAFRDL